MSAPGGVGGGMYMGQHAMGGGAMAAGHMAWPGGMQQMQGALGTADSATLPSPLGLEQPAKKRRRKKQPRDPNCPKRPTPPFLLFCLEQRVALKAAGTSTSPAPRATLCHPWPRNCPIAAAPAPNKTANV